MIRAREIDLIGVHAQLLAASTENQVDEVFETLFDIIHDARCTGYVVQLVELVDWSSSTANLLNHEVLLSFLRLSSSMRHALEPEWSALYEAVKQELFNRDLDAARLLWGLAG